MWSTTLGLIPDEDTRDIAILFGQWHYVEENGVKWYNSRTKYVEFRQSIHHLITWYLRVQFLSIVEQVFANERRHYICDIFSHWLRTCSAIDLKHILVINRKIEDLHQWPYGVKKLHSNRHGFSTQRLVLWKGLPWDTIFHSAERNQGAISI